MDLFPVLLFGVVIVLIWLFNSLNVLREYERGVIFRVGRLLPEPKGPGLIWVFWPIDRHTTRLDWIYYAPPPNGADRFDPEQLPEHWLTRRRQYNDNCRSGGCGTRRRGRQR